MKKDMKLFAVYRRLQNGLMELVDFAFFPHYFTPVRVKYSLIEDGRFMSNIRVTYH